MGPLGACGLALLAVPVTAAQAETPAEINTWAVCRYLAFYADDVRAEIERDNELKIYHQLHLAVLLQHLESTCGWPNTAEQEQLGEAIGEAFTVNQ